MNLMCYQQNLLVRNKIEPGHATGSLALSLTHPWYRAGKAQVQLPRSRKCCSGTSQASLFLLVDKPWTLCAYWASNILARATGNGDVLTHWASGFQNLFLPCDVFKRKNKTSRGLTDLFSQADKPFLFYLHHTKTFLWLVKPGRQNNAHSRSSIVTTLNHNASLKIPKRRPSWKTYRAMKQNLRCFSSNLTIFSITNRNSSELIGTSLKSHEIYSITRTKTMR